MTTLFDIAWQVSQEMGDTLAGVATGGSTTSIVDLERLKNFPDVYFDRAPAFIITSTDNLAPENEFAGVRKYNPATFTITLNSTLTAAVASGDNYFIGSARYPLHDIIMAVNRTLREIGPIPLVDTSLSTSSTQTEYTIPATVRNIREVYIQTIDNDADDNQWSKLYDWEVERAATGSQDTLILGHQPAANKTLKIVYEGEHGNVHASSDSIANFLDPRLIIAGTVKNLIRSRVRSAGDNDPMLRQQYDDVMQEYEELKSKMVNVMPKRTQRLMIIGRRSPWLTSGE